MRVIKGKFESQKEIIMYILVWTRYIEELQRLSTREPQFDPIKRNTLTLTITIVNYQTRPNVDMKF